MRCAACLNFISFGDVVSPVGVTSAMGIPCTTGIVGVVITTGEHLRFFVVIVCSVCGCGGIHMGIDDVVGLNVVVDAGLGVCGCRGIHTGIGGVAGLNVVVDASCGVCGCRGVHMRIGDVVGLNVVVDAECGVCGCRGVHMGIGVLGVDITTGDHLCCFVLGVDITTGDHLCFFVVGVGVCDVGGCGVTCVAVDSVGVNLFAIVTVVVLFNIAASLSSINLKTLECLNGLLKFCKSDVL